ncbi:MAG: GAF domain-containing protein, partial [Nodosilinea sp.]
MAIYWGPDALLLYNDAWRLILGDGHPRSLGRPAHEVCSDTWSKTGFALKPVMATGEGVFLSDQPQLVNRSGYTEECFFDHTLSPIRGEGDVVVGVLSASSETTYRVLSDRRTQLLRELAAKVAGAKSIEEICASMTSMTGSNPVDIPLALLYIVNHDSGTACLCGGIGLGLPVAPAQVSLDNLDDSGGWPIAEVAQTAQLRIVDDLVARFGPIPGAGAEPLQEAAVLPLMVPGQAQAAGVLVAVANSRRRLDPSYRDFFSQVAALLAASFALIYARTAGQQVEQPIGSPPPSRLLLSAQSSSPLPAAQILLVGDNIDTLRHVAPLLNRRYQVKTVGDSGGALTAIRQQRPDLVLTGTMLPEPEAVELLRQLRADIQTKALPVILLLARAGDQPRLEGLTARSDDYLVEPFSVRELLRQVESTLKLAHLRQEAEAKIQRSEERSRLAIEVAQLGTWRYDLRTQRVDLDERMAEILGCSAASLPISQVFEQIHPAEREQVIRTVRATLDPTSSEVSEIDGRLLLQDGTERWISANGQTVFVDGEIRQAVELVGTAIDITERKQTELMLVEQKRLLELIAADSPIEDCLAAVCTTVSRLNSRVRAGFLLTDADQEQFFDAIAPELAPAFVENLSGISTNDPLVGPWGEAASIQQSVTSADIASDDRWSKVWQAAYLGNAIQACHSVPVMGTGSRPFGSFILCFDQPRLPTLWEYRLADFGAQVAGIAFKRDRATLALRDSEQRYRTLFESMDQGFCVCEMLFDDGGEPVDYRFLEVNPAFVGLTGLHQPIGKTALELVPNLENFWLETYSRVVLTGEPQRFEYESKAMNRWFDVRAFALEARQSHRFAILFTDISDR